MTTLYEKHGRRYVPVYHSESLHEDRMKVGTFRLTYAYLNGGQRYYYEVTPDTAGFCAAMMLAAEAMERVLIEELHAKPATTRPYTKQELALLEEFERRASEIGFLWPRHWIQNTAHEVVEKALRTVRDYRP